MRPYQEEYLSNLRQLAALSQHEPPGGLPYEEYIAKMLERSAQLGRLARRNMELLRTGLFPLLDNLFAAGPEELEELDQFSFQLFDGRQELDAGLFCQIHQALLSLARQKRDRTAMIRELYWLGMGRNSRVSKLVGLELSDIAEFTARMRLCFTEAAAYLKFFDEIEDSGTRSYILRSRANISLGQFQHASEKVRLVKKTLEILQDKSYQEKEPNLPWDRFIYLTHQNMASSISYNREKVMTPEDMADIMESAYIVYQQRFDEAEIQGKQPPAKSAFAYYATEYYCGLFGLDVLLSRTEALMDAADPTDYSPDGMYGMISLPAFYSQYLEQYPDQVPPRREYLEGLYRRILDYADACPYTLGNGSLFLFLRQLSFTFVETGGVSYAQFIQRLMLRFAPEIYGHSQIVGEGAKALCALILEDDPAFFDDDGFLRAIADPAEKRQAVLDYAMGCGAFHDVGKISVIELYSRTLRQWFEEEYEMARLHPLAGEILLAPRPSTSRYAPAALGHHAWYDGSRGYPDAYRRLECPSRQMVDVVALIDYLESSTSPARIYDKPRVSFEEAVQSAIQLEGRRFSPLLTARLRDARTAARIKAALEQGRHSTYRRMYEDALRTASRRPDREA